MAHLKMISEQLDENVIGKLTYLPERLGMYISKNEKIITVNTGISSDMFNAICLKDYDISWQVARDMFHAEGLPFALGCGFGDKGEKCRNFLEKLGLKYDEIETGMFVDITQVDRRLNYGKLKITQVGDEHTLDDFIAVYKGIVSTDAEAIERFYTAAASCILEPESSLKLFVGYIAERPIATGALFLYAGVAGIWDITVLPNFRRRGIATDMVAHLLIQGLDVYKYNTAVLTASVAGEKVYRKMGFQKIKDFFIYNMVG